MFCTHAFTAQIEIVIFELTEDFQELLEESNELLSEFIVVGNARIPLGKTGLPKISYVVRLVDILLTYSDRLFDPEDVS